MIVINKLSNFKLFLYNTANYTFQLFAVLFFLMMSVLGVGSGVALFSTINIIVVDSLPNVKFIFLTAMGCIVGFLVGLVYVTPVSYLLHTSYS